ncbi:MAG: amidohydrolase family protein [Halioglobus sp.]
MAVRTGHRGDYATGAALELFTVNAGRHKGHQFESGRLAPGMLADLIVVDRDPFATPANELHQVQVMTTMIDGDSLYSSGKTSYSRHQSGMNQPVSYWRFAQILQQPAAAQHHRRHGRRCDSCRAGPLDSKAASR